MKTKYEYIAEYAESLRPQMTQFWDMMEMPAEMQAQMFEAIVEVVSESYELEECKWLCEMYTSPMGKQVNSRLPAVLEKATVRGLELGQQYEKEQEKKYLLPQFN